MTLIAANSPPVSYLRDKHILSPSLALSPQSFFLFFSNACKERSTKNEGRAKHLFNTSCFIVFLSKSKEYTLKTPHALLYIN